MEQILVQMQILFLQYRSIILKSNNEQKRRKKKRFKR